MSISNVMTINGTEVTEHNRKISISEQISANDVDLASGHRRRYFTTNKKQFTLSWSYLPDLVAKTVDSRSARNFLFGIVNTSAFATVGVELEPGAGFSEYECYVDSYSESLIRRDLTTGCTYYDVSLTLTER